MESIAPELSTSKDQKFTGFSEDKKKTKGASSGKKKQQSFMPLIMFDEDSEGNIVPREVAP